ncbi:unnamed protein product, partial [Coregonus sp. 'balchen']
SLVAVVLVLAVVVGVYCIRKRRTPPQSPGAEDVCVIKQEEMFQSEGPSTLPEREGPHETDMPSSSCVSERIEEREAHVVHIKQEPDDWGDLVTQMVTATDTTIMSLSRLQRLSSHAGAWTSEPQPRPPPPLPAPWAREPLPPVPWAREPPPLPPEPAPWTREKQHLLPESAMSEAILTFQYQLSGVMETVLKTAMHEITRLVKDGFLEEVTQSKQEVDALKERVQQWEQRWRDREEEGSGMCVRCGCAGDTEEKVEALSAAEGYGIKQEEILQSEGLVALREAHEIHVKEEADAQGDWGDMVTLTIPYTDAPHSDLGLSAPWASEPQPLPPPSTPWTSEEQPSHPGGICAISKAKLTKGVQENEDYAAPVHVPSGTGRIIPLALLASVRQAHKQLGEELKWRFSPND